MVTLLLAAALKIVLHSGVALSTVPNVMAQVTVRSCDGYPVLLYQDPKMLIPLPNPFSVEDKFGAYHYFSVSGHEEVSISISPDLPPIVYSTCQKRRY